MAIYIEDIIEKAFEKAFLRLLEQTIQDRVEARLKKALEEREDFLLDEIEGLIEQVFHRIVNKEIVWGKNETGVIKKETRFTKLNLTEGDHL